MDVARRCSGVPEFVRDGVPVVPRGAIVQNEDGSVSETLAVSKHLVGKLIGKRGKNIRQLRATTATKVQIDQEGTDLGSDVRKVTICGHADKVAQCKHAIKQMVEESVSPQDGDVTLTVQCRKSMVGRIIGKDGETIKGLQRKHNVSIHIDQSCDPVNVTITGPDERTAEWCRQEVESLIAKVAKRRKSGETHRRSGGSALPA